MTQSNPIALRMFGCGGFARRPDSACAALPQVGMA